MKEEKTQLKKNFVDEKSLSKEDASTLEKDIQPKSN